VVPLVTRLPQQHDARPHGISEVRRLPGPAHGRMRLAPNPWPRPWASRYRGLPDTTTRAVRVGAWGVEHGAKKCFPSSETGWRDRRRPTSRLLHLYLKRAKSTELFLGSPTEHRSRLASILDIPEVVA
jgi:hypothetical protein